MTSGVMAVWAAAVTALFVYVNVHAAVIGLVHLACSPGASVVPHELVDDLDPDDASPDPDDPSDEEEAPRPPAGLDEDDVKHCASPSWLRLRGSGPRLASRERDELAHHRDHIDDLERPPRA